MQKIWEIKKDAVEEDDDLLEQFNDDDDYFDDNAFLSFQNVYFSELYFESEKLLKIYAILFKIRYLFVYFFYFQLKTEDKYRKKPLTCTP